MANKGKQKETTVMGNALCPICGERIKTIFHLKSGRNMAKILKEFEGKDVCMADQACDNCVKASSINPESENAKAGEMIALIEFDLKKSTFINPIDITRTGNGGWISVKSEYGKGLKKWAKENNCYYKTKNKIEFILLDKASFKQVNKDLGKQ